MDVNKGEIAWSSTLGINEALAELGDAGLKSGTKNLGGNIATASGLVFIGATNDRRFRAFDARTGKELWAAELPAGGHATPITYLGKDGDAICGDRSFGRWTGQHTVPAGFRLVGCVQAA